MPTELSFMGLPRPEPQSVNQPRDADRMTYLHELCKRGASAEAIKDAVLALGADLNALTATGVSPLGVALHYGHADAARALLDLGAETFIHAGGDKFFNAAAEAVYWGKGDMLPLLAGYGGLADVNKPSIRGADCIAIAVEQRYPHLIEPLARAGAFLNRENMKDGLTPLQYACRIGYATFIAPLVAMGAWPDQPNSRTGRTAIHEACQQGNLDCLEKLLAAGADPHVKTPEGRTTLMLAAESYRGASILRQLVKAGVAVNARVPATRETALHIAARTGSEAMADVLLKGGADPLLTDQFNLTAARRARQSNNYDTARTLERAEQAAEHAYFEKTWKKFNHG